MLYSLYLHSYTKQAALMLINEMTELASVQNSFVILGDVLVRANLMSSSTFSLFLDFDLMCTRVENPASQR